MNDTIKTYTQITKAEGLQILLDNNANAIGGMAFRDTAGQAWRIAQLVQIDCDQNTLLIFCTPQAVYRQCAKVTELDPCQAPDGCPELEPWMAFVGMNKVDSVHYGYAVYGGKWTECEGAQIGDAFAIDVRTAWAKEHFPKHCRIRNYKEPSPIAEGNNPAQLTVEQVGEGHFLQVADVLDETWLTRKASTSESIPNSVARFYFILGQANPTKGTT